MHQDIKFDVRFAAFVKQRPCNVALHDVPLGAVCVLNAKLAAEYPGEKLARDVNKPAGSKFLGIGA